MNYIELNIVVTPIEIGRDIVMAELAELGFESFVETELGLEAYIQQPIFNENEVKKLFSFNHEDFKVVYEVITIKEQNWNEVWESNFDPINVNDTCYVRAPFHEKINKFKFDIEIEPKMSFGTGHHETTFLMIQELLEMELTNKNVLDMGCGTGVLAILATYKKASKVVAVDIDEWAYENTKENCLRNHCERIEVLKGGVEMIKNKEFDLIIANINRNILIQNLENYTKSLNHNGHILLSGFFSSDTDLLLNEATKYGLQLLNKKTKNDWTLLHLNH